MSAVVFLMSDKSCYVREGTLYKSRLKCVSKHDGPHGLLQRNPVILGVYEWPIRYQFSDTLGPSSGQCFACHHGSNHRVALGVTHP